MEQILFNLHTHSHFCDGAQEPETYVQEAIRQGFHTLGFSSHAPVPFENRFAIIDEASLRNYVEEIRRLKEKYRNEIRILLSLEIDYIPGVTKSFNSFKSESGLDYTIGGVHLVRNEDMNDFWFIDGPDRKIYDEGLKRFFNRDIRLAVTTYWRQMREMISGEKPDIIAHLDKIKMHNRERFFLETEKWYEEELDATLELIAKEGSIVEVNTRGIYKGRSEELFPGKFALQKMLQLDIPVTLSSDAHKPEELSAHFEEAKTFLRKIGFRSLMVPADHGWQPTKL